MLGNVACQSRRDTIGSEMCYYFELGYFISKKLKYMVILFLEDDFDLASFKGSHLFSVHSTMPVG